MRKHVAVARCVGRITTCFGRVQGFRQTSFMVSEDMGRSARRAVVREVHVHPEGMFMLIRVLGSDCRARRQTEAIVRRAGYSEKWRLADEIGLRRFVSRRELRNELRYLTNLYSAKPVAPRRRAPPLPRWSRSQWQAMMTRVLVAPLLWSHWAVAFSHRVSLGRRGTVDVDIGCVGNGCDVTPYVSVRAQHIAVQCGRALRKFLENQKYDVSSFARGVLATRRRATAHSAVVEGLRIAPALAEALSRAGRRK